MYILMEKPGKLTLERHRLCNAPNGGQIVGFLAEADVVQLTSLSHHAYSSKNTSEYQQALSFHHCMAKRRDISNYSKLTHIRKLGYLCGNKPAGMETLI